MGDAFGSGRESILAQVVMNAPIFMVLHDPELKHFVLTGKDTFHWHLQIVLSHIVADGGSRSSTSGWLWKYCGTLKVRACWFRASARAVQAGSRTKRRVRSCCALMFAGT